MITPSLPNGFKRLKGPPINLDDLPTPGGFFDLPEGDGRGDDPPPTQRRGRDARAFVAGPLYWDELKRVAALPGQTLHLWLILKHRLRLARLSTGPVSVNLHGVKEEYGLERQAARRALQVLERASLIRVERRPNHNPLVTLLGQKEE
jgi:hypothetical protein